MMNNSTNSSSSYSEESILARIHEGMAVIDSTSENIGTVSDLYFGSAYSGDPHNDASDGEPQEPDSITDGVLATGNGLPVMPIPMGFGNVTMGATGAILPLFAFEDGVPAPRRADLLEQGLVQIRGNGLLGVARYVTAQQIASVHDNTVYLSVSRQQLVENV